MKEDFTFRPDIKRNAYGPSDLYIGKWKEWICEQPKKWKKRVLFIVATLKGPSLDVSSSCKSFRKVVLKAIKITRIWSKFATKCSSKSLFFIQFSMCITNFRTIGECRFCLSLTLFWDKSKNRKNWINWNQNSRISSFNS